MALPTNVKPGDPHAKAHNDERIAINQIEQDILETRAPMRGFFPIEKALATGSANILYMGDSKSEGTGLPSSKDRGLYKLQSYLRNQYSNADTGHGYIPAKYATFYDFSDKPIITGTTVDNRSFGLGRRAIDMPAGATVAFPALSFTRPNQIWVHWTRKPGGGTLEVLTDGVVRATIDTAGTMSSMRTAVNQVSTGSKQVVVRAKAGTAISTFEGIYHYTSLSGIKVIDGTISGGTFDFFGPKVPLGGHWTAAANYAPQGAIMAFGANDMGTQTPADVALQAANAADKFFNISPTGGLIILFGTERTETAGTGTVANFEAAIRRQFSRDSRVSILFESDLWVPKAGVDYTWGGPDGWLGDTVHTTADAHTEIAKYISRFLSRSSDVAPLALSTDDFSSVI